MNRAIPIRPIGWVRVFQALALLRTVIMLRVSPTYPLRHRLQFVLCGWTDGLREGDDPTHEKRTADHPAPEARERAAGHVPAGNAGLRHHRLLRQVNI